MDQYPYLLDEEGLSDFEDFPSSFLFGFTKGGMRPTNFSSSISS